MVDEKIDEKSTKMEKNYKVVKPEDNLYNILEIFTDFRELRFYPNGTLDIVTDYIVISMGTIDLINKELKKLFNQVVSIILYSLEEKALILVCVNIDKEVE